ncbi:hypothetical protein M8C21_033597 [Ambrosia artemisiifolia]|uniref:CCR4-NOT transcription complex subunit 4-like protein n=1 Tax=Ambrosia artemisiifolia TaxID=4212 RepID=A0AAD5BM94_AMBAR|nr:hypothetical protein M8C21_033597 [Ambrosia artemisiifolia]
MSDEGEKTCPLCAEEMDLTDQQLRPCKCGYDICVWCWHHVMEMAEKDGTEGRCPACRTPYNKEKIVGTASKCERLVAEMSVEKNKKSQKGKTKASEGRKHLSSVRVIQRNLVYIVGLPLNLADEDLLQRKEYFGQYGKVLKVSISRTAAGAIQHFANNTCSVYITYSKEDEAIRSIQSVHGFVLEGRPLRACFGTTKYCHAWLRSMPCTNPDCLYLHEFGSQEDSFTKDEIISEYTRYTVQLIEHSSQSRRGRVQQVTGATNELQRRSGNILPPAADDYSNNSTSSWGKPVSKTTTNDPVNSNSMKVSPPNSSSGRSVALPAAASWGTRASNSQPIAANITVPNGPSKQKVDTSTTQSSSTAAVSPSSHGSEIVKKYIEEVPTADIKGSRKTQNFNQSRFSFAREEDEYIDQKSNFTPNLSDFGNGLNLRNFSPDVYSSQHTDRNGFSSFNFEESDRTAGSYSAMSPNKFSGSRSQISAPPGFMGPSRAPPPGFASNERIEQTYDNNISGNHMFDSSFLVRKVNQAPGAVYNDGSVGELEFMDPAILAVGGRVPGGVRSPSLDMRSNYPSQLSSYENDSNRLRLLMQRSFTQQNLRFNEFGGDNLSFPQRTDSYGVPSRIIDQTLLNNNHRSHYQHQQQQQVGNFQQARMASSNGHWGDGWNEVQNGNDIAMAEILRNERLGGFNKYYSSYEDTKFRVPSSGDLYNRTFGI